MELIKNTIQGVLEGLVLKKTDGSETNPQALLEKALTKKELRHIKLNYFKKGILSISVDSSAWLYALSLRKENFLKEMNKGPLLIKDIQFRIGEITSG